MLCKIENTCRIFWGNRSASVEPEQLRGKASNSIEARTIAQHIGLEEIVLQHQIHDNVGLAVTPDSRQSYRQLLSNDSDYLVTNIPRLAIGVLTADCLPIALFDPAHRAIGMVHAGWRGTIKHIVIKALQHMHGLYGTKSANVRIFLGPSARNCCYSIDDAFITQLPPEAQAFVTNTAGKNFFDISTYNCQLLIDAGMPTGNIDRSNNICTICTPNFCSYRVNPGATIRQISIIGLDF